MAEAALIVAIFSLVVAVAAAFGTLWQAHSNAAELALAREGRAERKRARIAVSRTNGVSRTPAYREIQFLLTNVGQTHARETRARLTDDRREVLSDRAVIVEPIEPGATRTIELRIASIDRVQWLMVDWSDEEGWQEHLELVDDLRGR